MDETALTAIILTRNEESNIAACIESLRWAISVLVFDSFSTDRTVELAKQAGAAVIQHAFVNYAKQRNAALSECKTAWALFVDADERVSPELATEILGKLDKPENAWSMPRHNWIFGKLTLGAGWFPDFQTRLIRKNYVTYDPRYPVHEVVIAVGDVGYLTNPLTHLNYQTYRQFIEKQERYTDIAAEELHQRGVKPKPRMYITMPLREFHRRFIAEKGYIDGVHGFRLSVLMAYYEFQKWRRAGQLARTV